MNGLRTKLILAIGLMIFPCCVHAENLSTAISYITGQPPAVEWHIYTPESGEDVIFQELQEVPVDIFWPESGDKVIFRVANQILEARWPVTSRANRLVLIPSNLQDKVIRIWKKDADGIVNMATYHTPHDKSGDMPAEIQSHQGGHFVAVWELARQPKLKEVVPTEYEKCDALGPDVIGKMENGSTLFDRYLNASPEAYSGVKWIAKKVDKSGMGSETSGEAMVPSRSIKGTYLKARVDRNWFAPPFSIVSSNGITLFTLRRDPQSFEPLISFDDRGGILILNLHSSDPMEYQVLDLKTGQLLKSIKAPHEYHKKLSRRIPKLFWVQVPGRVPTNR